MRESRRRSAGLRRDHAVAEARRIRRRGRRGPARAARRARPGGHARACHERRRAGAGRLAAPAADRARGRPPAGRPRLHPAVPARRRTARPGRLQPRPGHVDRHRRRNRHRPHRHHPHGVPAGLDRPPVPRGSRRRHHLELRGGFAGDHRRLRRHHDLLPVAAGGHLGLAGVPGDGRLGGRAGQPGRLHPRLPGGQPPRGEGRLQPRRRQLERQRRADRPDGRRADPRRLPGDVALAGLRARRERGQLVRLPRRATLPGAAG